jgi:RimJ/RimL family protein N-acetyltransferase
MTMLVNLEVRNRLYQFLDHYSNLTSDDRHNRFFHTMGPTAIRDWVLTTTEQPYSHYFFVKENESGQFEGLVTLGIEPYGIGNIAISILPNCRGQGLAQNLMSETIDAAKKLKLETLEFECLTNNHDCKRLLTKMGFTCNYNAEQECLVGHLDLENQND